MYLALTDNLVSHDFVLRLLDCIGLACCVGFDNFVAEVSTIGSTK